MKRSINGVVSQTTTGLQGPAGATGATGPVGPQGAAGGLTTIVGGNTQTSDAMLMFQVADAEWTQGIDHDIADRPFKIQRVGFGDVISCSGTGAIAVPGVVTYSNNSLQILGPLSTVSALGTDCVAIGTSALAGGSGYGTVALGSSTGGAGGAGELNTFVGYRAGANSTGNNNTVVGGNAQAGMTTANSIAIGFDATVQASNECVIGNSQLSRIRPMGVCDLGSVNDPFNSLYVQGKIAMTSTTEAFTPPQTTTGSIVGALPGNMIYNTVTNKLAFYNGSGWFDLAVANAPPAVEWPLVAMTGNAAPSPYVASASTEINAGNAAYCAFNKKSGAALSEVDAGGWHTTFEDVTPTNIVTVGNYGRAWLQVDLGSSVTINSFRIWGSYTYPERAPTVFRLGASSDGVTWTSVYYQNTALEYLVVGTSIGDGYRHSGVIYCSAPGSYRYYRLCVATPISGYLMVQELRLFT